MVGRGELQTHRACDQKKEQSKKQERGGNTQLQKKPPKLRDVTDFSNFVHTTALPLRRHRDSLLQLYRPNTLALTIGSSPFCVLYPPSHEPHKSEILFLSFIFAFLLFHQNLTRPSKQLGSFMPRTSNLVRMSSLSVRSCRMANSIQFFLGSVTFFKNPPNSFQLQNMTLVCPLYAETRFFRRTQHLESERASPPFFHHSPRWVMKVPFLPHESHTVFQIPCG